MYRKLYTWINVEKILLRKHEEGEWPDSLANFIAYHDELELLYRENSDIKKIRDKLRDWFGLAYKRDEDYIRLESTPDVERGYPVSFEPVSADEKSKTIPVKPLFNRIALVPSQLKEDDFPEVSLADYPDLIAFYSYKGGVGRTTHLLALLKALTDKSKKVLVIDGDLEASALKDFVYEVHSQPEISFIDFIALAHSDIRNDFKNALEVTKYNLENQQIDVPTENGPQTQYFLPAFRFPEQAFEFEIRPEHLIQTSDTRWEYAHLLAKLGQALGVDAVLIDLRAGLSEISSCLLLDPRVKRVLVTTPATESLAGTKLVLRQLAKVDPPMDKDDFSLPEVLITFVNNELVKSDRLIDIQEDLKTQYINEVDQSLADIVSPIEVNHTMFASELYYVSDLKDLFEKLSGTSIAAYSKRFADLMFISKKDNNEEKFKQIREKLLDVAKKYEYAESGEATDFLSIPYLREMCLQFRNRIPIAFICGLKGTGKTYTFLQMAKQKSWSKFVDRILMKESKNEWGLVAPILTPGNLKPNARDIVIRAQRNIEEKLDIVFPSSEKLLNEVSDNFSIENNTNSDFWQEKWIDVIAKSMGVAEESKDKVLNIINKLNEKNLKVTILIDGLEELFNEIDNNLPQKTALRTLLENIPKILQHESNDSLGLIIFIDLNYLLSAFTKNLRLNLKKIPSLSFPLKWSIKEIVKLVLWLCHEAGFPIDKPIESLSDDEVLEALQSVWGLKLGKDTSREARSTEWILAALSDFLPQIQARDVVRFIYSAAEKSQIQPYLGRLLAPTAIREAIQYCGEKKIEDLKEENLHLKKIFDKFEENKATLKIPFDAKEINLTSSEIEKLIDYGIIYKLTDKKASEAKYIMPEIYRQGFGLEFEGGARKPVLQAARLAMAKKR